MTQSYRIAPPGWSIADSNPFTPDGSYSADWSAFCLLDCDDDQFVTGRSGKGPFSARFGQRVPHIGQRLNDFLCYENSNGRTVILSFPPGVNAEAFITHALESTPASNVVRPDDPAVIVHSTTSEAWQSILVDGALKAASQLDRQPSRDTVKPNPVAAYLAGEPPEYPDYIMFGDLDSCVPEMVVASYRAGAWVLDPDAVYQPGVRLYFDNHRIIRDGLGVRDGLHTIKAHHRLPLQPYLLATVSAEDIDPQGSVRIWTLKTFVERANERFRI